jgi:hypothetical protein
MIDTRTERHDLPMMAPAAILRGVGRVHSKVAPTSFFRFAGQFAEKLRPRGIMNAFGQTMVMSHAVDVQVFHTDDPIAIHNLTTFLMGEVITSEGYSFMDTSDSLAVLATQKCPFCEFTMLTLYFRQGSLFLAKKARIRYLLSIREGGKPVESYIYPNLGRYFRHVFRFDFIRIVVVWHKTQQESSGNPLYPCPKQGTPLSSPWINRRGFQRRRLVKRVPGDHKSRQGSGKN